MKTGTKRLPFPAFMGFDKWELLGPICSSLHILKMGCSLNTLATVGWKWGRREGATVLFSYLQKEFSAVRFSSAGKLFGMYVMKEIGKQVKETLLLWPSPIPNLKKRVLKGGLIQFRKTWDLLGIRECLTRYHLVGSNHENVGQAVR